MLKIGAYLVLIAAGVLALSAAIVAAAPYLALGIVLLAIAWIAESKDPPSDK